LSNSFGNEVNEDRSVCNDFRGFIEEIAGHSAVLAALLVALGPKELGSWAIDLTLSTPNSGVQEFRSSGVQEFRSSGVQEFRSSGVQEFRSSGVPWWGGEGICKPKLLWPGFENCPKASITGS
jgi:hypothetical protein